MTAREHSLAVALGLARSEQVLRVRSLYTQRKPVRDAEVDEGLMQECWAAVKAGEGSNA